VLEVLRCNGVAGGDVRLHLLCLGRIQSLPKFEASKRIPRLHFFRRKVKHGSTDATNTAVRTQRTRQSGHNEHGSLDTTNTAVRTQRTRQSGHNEHGSLDT
jgi:hypothetical protein